MVVSAVIWACGVIRNVWRWYFQNSRGVSQFESHGEGCVSSRSGYVFTYFHDTSLISRHLTSLASPSPISKAATRRCLGVCLSCRFGGTLWASDGLSVSHMNQQLLITRVALGTNGFFNPTSLGNNVSATNGGHWDFIRNIKVIYWTIVIFGVDVWIVNVCEKEKATITSVYGRWVIGFKSDIDGIIHEVLPTGTPRWAYGNWLHVRYQNLFSRGRYHSIRALNSWLLDTSALKTDISMACTIPVVDTNTHVSSLTARDTEQTQPDKAT